MGIRQKGFVGSLSTTKPAVKVELDRNIAGRNWMTSRFTFNNAHQDPSLRAPVPVLRFFAAAGIAALQVCPSHGERLGPASHEVETIKEPFLARNFPSAAGKLWEGTVSDFWPGSWSGTFEPETDAAEEDRTELDATATALSTLSGQALLDELGRYVDVDQFIRYWAAEAVVGHLDGYHVNGNNFFAYVDPTVARAQFFPGTQIRISPPTARSIRRACVARKLYNIPRPGRTAQVQDLLDHA